jgi:hypothetical protein
MASRSARGIGGDSDVPEIAYPSEIASEIA